MITRSVRDDEDGPKPTFTQDGNYLYLGDPASGESYAYKSVVQAGVDAREATLATRINGLVTGDRVKVVLVCSEESEHYIGQEYFVHEIDDGDDYQTISVCEGYEGKHVDRTRGGSDYCGHQIWVHMVELVSPITEADVDETIATIIASIERRHDAHPRSA